MSQQPYTIVRKDHITTIIPQFHRHTVIWIHGLDQHRQQHMSNVIKALDDKINQVKVIIPRAPDRFITVMNQKASGWFDAKFRSEKCFQVPFDQAFSTKDVLDSYQRILKPIIVEQSAIVRKNGGKLLVCGFSQGCGMSLHCFFSLPSMIDFCVGISGFLFPFTPFNEHDSKRLQIIYGLADDYRPWNHSKLTYEGKLQSNRITLVQQMNHSFNATTQKVFHKLLQQNLQQKPKL